jgi:hypothetical protein
MNQIKALLLINSKKLEYNIDITLLLVIKSRGYKF